MSYNITSIDDAQAIVNDVNDYYVGVEVEFSTNGKELAANDTLVRVFADNDYDDDGSKILVREFYMTGNTFNSLNV
jgi:hypothetical protein